MDPQTLFQNGTIAGTHEFILKYPRCCQLSLVSTRYGTYEKQIAFGYRLDFGPLHFCTARPSFMRQGTAAILSLNLLRSLHICASTGMKLEVVSMQSWLRINGLRAHILTKKACKPSAVLPSCQYTYSQSIQSPYVYCRL